MGETVSMAIGYILLAVSVCVMKPDLLGWLVFGLAAILILFGDWIDEQF